MTSLPLKSPAELARRLAVDRAPSLLLIDVPDVLERLLAADRAPSDPPRSVAARSLRSVKERFSAVLLWREDRVGSRAILEAAVKRLDPEGVLWVVTAIKKVSGPRTPAAHRLEASDLDKAFAAEGLTRDREVRVSAWHVAHRFVKRETGKAKRSD